MLKFGQMALMTVFLCLDGSAADSVWYYQNMNHSNVVEYRSVSGSEKIVTHRWYIHPKDEDESGNYLSIVYKEDTKLPPLSFAKEIKEDEFKDAGGFYFTCGKPPERYFFSNGFYFTRFVITNYETEPDSCLLRALLPRSSERPHDVHPMKNPGIGIAASKLEGEKPQVISESAPPVKRVARRVPSRMKLERGASFKPPEGAKIGTYQRISEMPPEVLEK